MIGYGLFTTSDRIEKSLSMIWFLDVFNFKTRKPGFIVG